MIFNIITEFKQVSKSSTCTCPGHVLTFECTVMGGSVTIWRGSALGCDIILAHDRYNESLNYNKTCSSNRNIIGWPRNVLQNMTENGTNSYRSQLNITVTASMFGERIECIHEGGSTMNNNDIIGFHVISTGFYNYTIMS